MVMKYEEPNMQIVLWKDDVIRTSDQFDDYEDWEESVEDVRI